VFRSLIVSFGCGCGGSDVSTACDCDEVDDGLDSSDELSELSGVSESKSGSGERRLLAREGGASSSSGSTLLRFLERVVKVAVIFGGPAWGPTALRTEE
jgi:hypothetical protein